MKHKGVIIELTALLDVIFIMLFWVMMNVQESQSSAVDQAEKRASNAEALLYEAESKLAEFDEKKAEELERVWSLAKELDKNAAANQEALVGYEKGMLLTLNIRYDESGVLYVSSGSDQLGEASTESVTDIYNCMIESLDKLKRSPDDVILCALVYDGDTTLIRDYRTVNAAVDMVRKQYKSFYCTYINTTK